MQTSIEDGAQRLLAVSPEESFIVQAPAGSGKTELLIQRYLRLLSLVDAPEEIVAITFTRKAAVEMQGRILGALEQAQAGSTAVEGHRQLTRELAEAVLKRSLDQGWHINENPGRLRIQTIDSLCAGLVRQMPVLSGLGGTPGILDDPVPVYEQAAVETLRELESDESWSDAVSRLLVHLDNDLPRIKTLLAAMLGKRDQWLGHIIHAHERSDLQRSLLNLAGEKLDKLIALFPAGLADELCVLLRYAAAQLLAGGIPGSVIQCEDIQSLPGNQADDLQRWCAIAGFLLTQKGTWRIRLDKNSGFPPAAESKADSTERTRMKQAMLDLIARLREVDGLEKALADISQLPPLTYTDEEWEVVDAVRNLLTLSAGHLRLLFREKNQVDFAEITLAAITALGDETESVDLAIHLDYQIRHLLVDEFQDISASQSRLLECLTASWSGDDGRTLFLVGDPMQSIYRFREAEVGNFIRACAQQRLGQVKLHPLALTVNFRSTPGIVEWVNKAFTGIFPPENDITTGAIRLHPSTAGRPGPEADDIHVYPSFNDPGTVEAAKIVEVVRSLRTSLPDDSVAILVRNRNHLLEIIPALRQAGIRFRAVEIDALAARPAIQDLLALTRAWLHPADRIAWLSVLRAPWCGLNLATLLRIAGNQRQGMILEACSDESILSAIDEDSRRRLHSLTAVFKEALQHRQRRSIRSSIESIWCRLGGPATLLEGADLENTRMYFELLESLDAGGDIADLQLLASDAAKLFAAADNSADENSLQIMTIHKAKGLEFDHVLLPGLGKVSRARESELLKWMLRARSEAGYDLFLAPIKEAGQKQAPIYQYIQAVEKEQGRHEDSRLLYVAVTRARKSLHLSGSAGLKMDKNGDPVCTADARSLLAHLWPVLGAEYQAAIMSGSSINPRPVTGGDGGNLRRLRSSWRLPPAPVRFTATLPVELTRLDMDGQRLEYVWAGETIRHTGSVVHRCIQQIAKQGRKHWHEGKIKSQVTYYRSLLQQSGVPGSQLQWATDQVTTALMNMLRDDRGRWILSDDHADARNEYALSGIYRNDLVNIVIDRTFIDTQGTRWIVDYKTSRHEGTDREAFLDREQLRYTEQLEKYAALLKVMEHRPIRLGLYFPLLQGWREWEYIQ